MSGETTRSALRATDRLTHGLQPQPETMVLALGFLRRGPVFRRAGHPRIIMAHKKGSPKVRRNPKTHAPITQTALAKERDEYHCMWHLVFWGVLRPGTDGHHLFRPRDKYDEKKYIITLCHECHLAARHTKGELTDQMLIDEVMIPYIWGGEDLSPKAFKDEILYP